MVSMDSWFGNIMFGFFVHIGWWLFDIVLSLIGAARGKPAPAA